MVLLARHDDLLGDGHLRHAHAGRRRVLQGRARPGQGLDVHQFVEQRQVREVGDVGVVGVRLDLLLHRRELRGQAIGEVAARQQRDAPAVAVRDLRRVVVRVGAEVAGRRGGVLQPVAPETVRPAQQPELGEPADVREVPGDRLDLDRIRHHPAVVVEVHAGRERASPRLLQRRAEPLRREPAGGVHGRAPGAATKNA